MENVGEGRIPSPPPPPASTDESHDSVAISPSLMVQDKEEREEREDDDAGLSDPDEDLETVSGSTAVLSDDLRDRIVRQVEYYFSDENLPTDKFLLKFVKKTKEGFVPIGLISSFRKMKKLVQDPSLIEAALMTSSNLVVSSDGKKVRRLKPLPFTEVKDSKLRTVVVENLPESYCTDSIQRIFGEIGKIVSITVQDPHCTEESSTSKKPAFVISSKIHALVEYESVEVAEKAAGTLNDEKNWRTGMRVELLSKRMGYGKFPKVEKDNLSKKGKDVQGEEIDGDRNKSKPIGQKYETEEEHGGNSKGRRGRNKNRGKGHPQHNATVHGHGPTPSSSAEFISKPIPGPRMPDGTRGFTMGRGKPIRNLEDKPSEPNIV